MKNDKMVTMGVDTEISVRKWFLTARKGLETTQTVNRVSADKLPTHKNLYPYPVHKAILRR